MNFNIIEKKKKEKKNNNIVKIEKKKDEYKLSVNNNFGIISNKKKKNNSLIETQFNINIFSKNINQYNNPNLKVEIEKKKDNGHEPLNYENINDINSFYDNNQKNNINQNQIIDKKENSKSKLNKIETKTSNYSGYFSGLSTQKKDSENNKFNDYSYNYEINNQLIKKDDQNKKINLKIFNNGQKKWIENQTFLILIDNKNFFCEKIRLAPLNSNESQEIAIPLKEKNNVSNGKYILEMEFRVNNLKYGNSFQIVFEIQ